jgi:photosystem II stability/assembly factor-like uncharacterized protein
LVRFKKLLPAQKSRDFFMKTSVQLLILSLLFFACKQPDKKIEGELKPAPLEVKLHSELLDSMGQSIRGISVVDSNTIWLSGARGTILKWDAQEKRWLRLNSPDSLDFRDIEAFSASSAIVMSAGFPSKVFKTSDGGYNWRLVHENADSSAFMNSIAFKNKLEGVIVGDVLNGHHLILHTNNGGESWKRVEQKNLPIPLEVENGFAASGSSVIVDIHGNYHFGLGGERVRIFSSKDGRYWKASETAMKGGSSSNGIYALASGKDKVIAVGGNYLEVDSAHSPLLSSSEMKWESTSGVLHGYRSTIAYSPSLDYWLAAGSNGIDISTDTGKSWQKVSDLDLNVVRFIPASNKAIASDKRGRIFLLRLSIS